MNLGGVRVPSNPDLFWRSSMSGLDGFRLGDYSSERVSPHRSRAQCAHNVRGVLILASDRLKAELPVLRHVVPASAGGASASPHALDSPTRCRLKAGLHAWQNENCCGKRSRSSCWARFNKIKAQRYFDNNDWMED